MVAKRNKIKFVTAQNCGSALLLLLGAVLLATTNCLAIQQQNGQDEVNSLTDATGHTFSSPRLEYNNHEWRPVGRGDPLKNDPTYDYSPPALERVRYWAETDKSNATSTNSTATSSTAENIEQQQQPHHNIQDLLVKQASMGKNEILLLGVANNERMRPHHQLPTKPLQQQQQPQSAGPPAAAYMHKNFKGETPLLQPKYTSIRRSYYAHQQLPTHLMPPPMQALNASPQQPHQQPQMFKPAHGDYRHSMPSNNYMSTMGMPAHSHSTHHYSTAATSPWMHTSAAMSNTYNTPPHMPPQMHHTPTQRMPQTGYTQMSHMPHASSSPYDTHHQASSNYFSYSRPGGNSLEPQPQHANAIHPPYTMNAKQTQPPRKPWVHELLQKELIKPAKPTAASTKFYMAPTKPYFEPMVPVGISTTYKPVSFLPTIPTTTTTTTTEQPPIRPMAMYTSSPVFITAPPPTTTTTTTTTTYAPPPSLGTTYNQHQQIDKNRLLIPNTSNMPNRPTVAPMDMTTDSLFSHYKQPKKPLVGPMYLIIEGHSKVKTYGQNELDPHQPKIVPIIPNREPVVRRADPNERRGTPETFEVKHLHSKPTEMPATTTTSAPSTTTTRTPTTTKTPKPAEKTTKKPTGTTAKPTKASKPAAMPTKTTSAPTKATSAPMKPTAAAAKPVAVQKQQTMKPSAAAAKPGMQQKQPAVTTTSRPTTTTTTATTTTTTRKPPALETTNGQQSAGAMQGLFSFLDASLDSLFKEEPLMEEATTVQPKMYVTTQSTKLRPITTMKIAQPQPRIEPRVSAKNITSMLEDYDDDNNEEGGQIGRTTESLLRATRQVFDYDQLPDARLKHKMGEEAVSFEEIFDDAADGGSVEEMLGVDNEMNKQDEADDEQEEDDDNEPITILKRIDKLVDDDSGENVFEELVSQEADELINDRIDTDLIDEDDGERDDEDDDDDDDGKEYDDEFDVRGKQLNVAHA